MQRDGKESNECTHHCRNVHGGHGGDVRDSDEAQANVLAQADKINTSHLRVSPLVILLLLSGGV